jgi:hypothetical protein
VVAAGAPVVAEGEASEGGGAQPEEVLVRTREGCLHAVNRTNVREKGQKEERWEATQHYVAVSLDF